MRVRVAATKHRGARLMSALLWLGGCPAGDGGTTEVTAATGTTAAGTDGQPTTTDGTSGEGTSTTTTTGASTTEACTTTTGSVDFGCDDVAGVDPEVGVCACIVDDPEGDWGTVPSDPLCGETLCPTIHAVTSFWCHDIKVMNPDALTCALTALRDRTPGLVRWTWEGEGGISGEAGYVLIQADGTAIRRHWGGYDLTYEVSDARWGTLPSACALEMCLAAGSEEVRFECVRNFRLAPPNVTCDDGWQRSFD
jgi:hypothetical protein